MIQTKKINEFEQSINGGISAAISTGICYPIDTIKTRYQLLGGYNRSLFSKSPMNSLFKGIQYDMIGSVGSSIVYWKLYDYFRHSEYSISSSAVYSSVISNVFDSPFDLVKRSRQCNIVNTSILSYTNMFPKYFGCSIVYSGLYNFINLNVINSVIKRDTNNQTSPTFLQKSFGILFGSVLANTICYPLDHYRTFLIEHANSNKATSFKSFTTAINSKFRLGQQLAIPFFHRIIYSSLYSQIYMNVFLYLQNNKL